MNGSSPSLRRLKSTAVSPAGRISPIEFTVKPNKGGVITSINPNDVLSGRGGSINSHSGNVQFRRLLKERLLRNDIKYQRRKEAFDVVRYIRQMDPPGRFLKEDRGCDGWHEIGDVSALRKAQRGMRDCMRFQDDLNSSNIADDGDSSSSTSSSEQREEKKEQVEDKMGLSSSLESFFLPPLSPLPPSSHQSTMNDERIGKFKRQKQYHTLRNELSGLPPTRNLTRWKSERGPSYYSETYCNQLILNKRILSEPDLPLLVNSSSSLSAIIAQDKHEEGSRVPFGGEFSAPPNKYLESTHNEYI